MTSNRLVVEQDRHAHILRMMKEVLHKTKDLRIYSVQRQKGFWLLDFNAECQQ